MIPTRARSSKRHTRLPGIRVLLLLLTFCMVAGGPAHAVHPFPSDAALSAGASLPDRHDDAPRALHQHCSCPQARPVAVQPSARSPSASRLAYAVTQASARPERGPSPPLEPPRV